MRISRLRRYKNKKSKKLKLSNTSNKGLGNQSSLKKIILSSALVGTALFSSSIVYADTNLSDYLKGWYLERLNDAEAFLTSSTETETVNQKANLLRQVREQTEQSVRELQEYAASKNSTINQNIEEKAKETLNTIQTQNQSDVDSVKKQIDEQANSEQQKQPVNTDNKDTDYQNNSSTENSPNNTNDLQNDEKNVDNESPTDTNILPIDENSSVKSIESNKLGLE